MHEQPRALREPIPAEFQGLARDFRAQVRKQTAIYDTEVCNILVKLRTHWDSRSQHKVRQEVLRGVARDWLVRVPAFGRLDININTNKHALSIAECRLISGTTRFLKWQSTSNELSVSAEIAILICEPARFSFTYDCRSIFSFHALGRRFQRSTRNHKHVVEDLIAVVQQQDRLLASDKSDFAIPCARGVWYADRCLVNFDNSGDQRRAEGLAVRTFIEHPVRAPATAPARAAQPSPRYARTGSDQGPSCAILADASA